MCDAFAYKMRRYIDVCMNTPELKLRQIYEAIFWGFQNILRVLFDINMCAPWIMKFFVLSNGIPYFETSEQSVKLEYSNEYYNTDTKLYLHMIKTSPALKWYYLYHILYYVHIYM